LNILKQLQTFKQHDEHALEIKRLSLTLREPCQNVLS